MSLRLEMLQAARLAPKVLGESSELARDFFRRQQNPDGGFKDRDGRSDLYYTVFGLDGLTALQADIDFHALAGYLEQFGNGSGLDFVHLCCLARCRGALLRTLPGALPPSEADQEILAALEKHRALDGGFHPRPGHDCGTAYAAFLALGAYQDMGTTLPDPLRLVQSLKFLETPDGAWANERNITAGSTNATAAAVMVLRNLRMPVNAVAGQWLLARAHAQGGFLAAPNAPMPDLLSTATALHALAALEHDFSPVKEACLDFIDSLWTNEGAFFGHWSDETTDCEYTYYALLALGHLSY